MFGGTTKGSSIIHRHNQVECANNSAKVTAVLRKLKMMSHAEVLTVGWRELDACENDHFNQGMRRLGLLVSHCSAVAYFHGCSLRVFCDVAEEGFLHDLKRLSKLR